MKRALVLIAATGALALPSLASAQDHSGHVMPQPTQDSPTPDADPHAGHDTPSDDAPAMGHGAMDHSQMDHSGHDMSAMSGMDHGAHGGHAMEADGTPPVPRDNYADQFFSPTEMGHARHAMMQESGGRPAYLVMLDIAEYQLRKKGDGYRWEGEAWFGADINRLTIKTEGEGTIRDKTESAEIQALYSRAVGPYFNLQAGVRQDIRPSPNRTYAVIGFEGLAPYQFELDGALFLSTKGDLLARLGGYYDQRLTQRLILQPRVELNFAAQHVREHRLSSGLTDAEIGLRLRYEIKRELAPYLGISWERKTSGTARMVRAAGEETGGFAFVGGIRIWF